MNTANALAALSALAQQTRLAVFRQLVKAGDGGLPAGDIARLLSVRKNTLSTHLAILSQAQLVEQQRDGRVIRYRANYARMRALLMYLMKDCCQGNKAICSPLVDALATT